MQAFTRTLMRKSDAVQQLIQGYGSVSELFKLGRKVEQLLRRLDDILNRHPQWKLGEIRQKCPLPQERLIVVALLGKRLGHLPAGEPLFTGGGLARAVSAGADCVAQNFRFLTADSNLVLSGLIQPCSGDAELASDNATELEQTEFELTATAVGLLGLDKRMAKSRFGEFAARPATIKLDQLVLSDRVRRALEMAIVHARHGKRLMDDWGLGEVVRYGRGPVLLFSGPPGTGKTATAEALARELDKPILVADYSRIQNCFVGRTEKNIVRVFREAKNQDALLFWDEADAMFYDRDSTHRNWEVRDVNVLLQELERFDGVCVLATNRKITLDKALGRRITMKVEFERPDRQQRARISGEVPAPQTAPGPRCGPGGVDGQRLCRRGDQEHRPERGAAGPAPRPARAGPPAGFSGSRPDGAVGAVGSAGRRKNRVWRVNEVREKMSIIWPKHSERATQYGFRGLPLGSFVVFLAIDFLRRAGRETWGASRAAEAKYVGSQGLGEVAEWSKAPVC